MADLVKELGIKVTIDSSGIASGAAGVGTALESAGKKGADGLELTSAAARDVEAYLKRIEAAGVAPDTLARNAEKAAAALAVLNREAAETGTEIPAQFAGAGAAIEAATARASAMRTEMERIGQTPTKLDVLVSSVNSLISTEEKATSETQAFLAQIQKLNAAESPRGLTLGIVQLQQRLEELKVQAAAAGAEAGPRFAAAIQQGEAAITANTRKLGVLKDEMQDTAKKAGVAAEGYKTLAMAGGGLPGVFMAMDDAGKGWISTLGKVGLVGFGVTQAFGLMKEAGAKLGEMLAHEVDHWDDARMAMQKAMTATIEYDAARKLEKAGILTNIKSYEDLIEKYHLYEVASGRSKVAAEDLGKTLGLTLPEHTKEAVKAAEKLAAVIDGAFAQSLTQGTRVLLDNQGAIKKLIDAVQDGGAKLPPALAKYLPALKSVADAEKDVAERATQAANAQGAFTTALLKAAESAASVAKGAEKDIGKAYDDQAKALKEINAELNAGTISLQEHSDKKKKIVQETTKVVLEANDKEEESQKAAEDAVNSLARQYHLSVDQVKEMIAKQAELNAKDALSVETKEKLKGMTDLFIGSLKAQDAQYGTTRDETTKTDKAMSDLAESFKKTAGQAVDGKQNYIEFSKSMTDVGEKAEDAKTKLNLTNNSFINIGVTAGEAGTKIVNAMETAQARFGTATASIEQNAERMVRALNLVAAAARNAAGGAGGATGGTAGGTPPVGPFGAGGPVE